MLIGRWSDSLQLSHDDFHGLADDIGERVQSSSMCHANDKGASTLLSSGVDQVLESWNESLTTLQSESLHSVKLLGKEGTPLMSPV